MKTVSTEDRWKAALTPLAKHVQKTRGALVALCAELHKRTGKEWHRNVVSSWLAFRFEPNAGIGLALLEIALTWGIKCKLPKEKRKKVIAKRPAL